jgi:uncharacterized protein YggU (UPF0235/DUF167 family)
VFLARALGVSKLSVSVVSGQTSRRKRIEFPDEAKERFEGLFK